MTDDELKKETLPEETTEKEVIESAQTNIEESPGGESEETPEENPEETPEETPEEATGEETYATVSDGDSEESNTKENVEAGIGSDIVEVILSAEQNALFEKNNELLENLTLVIEKQNAPITEKLLIDYTVSEGLLLLITVFAMGVFIGRIIGRIIPCRI